MAGRPSDDHPPTYVDVPSTEPQTDYAGWGVEETCRYLRAEGLGEWEDAFREHRITGVGLRYLADADLEKMGLKLHEDRLRVLHILRKLWQIEVEPSKKPGAPEMAGYVRWGVEETCQYLRDEGLGEWEVTFREHRITGVGLRYLAYADLEKMGLKFLGDRLRVLHSLRKLWQIEAEPSKVFNDPIHGHMVMHPLLIKIIDTPQFQRLRHIKQLGGVYFVFPGASHNRFEHSLGVAHLAGELVRALKRRQGDLDIDDRDVLCVQIAGLCHDLGHGPFSHMFDGKFIPKAGSDPSWTHEKASVQMFDHLVADNNLKSEMEKKHGLVLPEDLDFIKEMIAGLMDPKDPKWPYKGRPKDKSFLYEIVSNKRNGIDVDKWDYFARDCYHLGIKNNFDYGRCLMFARVCEVKGRKQICFRDKEVGNLYDMFYTRDCLHRRAYKHKAVNIVETMITEAFWNADKFIRFEGSKGKMFKLSETIDDMEAYTKVTDDVFQKILNTSFDELNALREILNRANPIEILNPKNLENSKEILKNVVCRNLYKCLGQALPPKHVNEKIASWEDDLAQCIPQDVVLNPEDFIIDVINFDYGMKKKNPINSVRFYSKDDPNKGFRISKEQVSKLLPQQLSKQLIQVSCKKLDSRSLEAAKENFELWCSHNDFWVIQDEDILPPLGLL
ncbi:deoxynucleoside triphosphate triphosphohydrolase SAMHD1-like isoform X2 [Gasterosteus aculeatus]